MARKELIVKTIAVSFLDGKRIEKPWDDIPKEDQEEISRNITNRFMLAAGYRRADREPARE